MRAFLVACVAFIAVGAGGYFTLNAVQNSTGAAYSTNSVRIDPSWSWRVGTSAAPPQQCAPRKIWQWFFVDFRDPKGEPALCSDSQ